MMTEVGIHSERVDDIPVLIAQQQRMGIPEVVDGVIHPHGNHQGLSMGWIAAGWLSYILSEGDHRMEPVESWVAERQGTLSCAMPQPVRAKDFADDRLADVLKALGDDENWEAVETHLGQRLVRVYDLKQTLARLDSTSVVVYHDLDGNGLFQYGHSKDHRPDLLQFKVMLATLDPMGMPLATLVVKGNAADDGLYIPTIRRTRPIVGSGGRLYVGDAKMSALATRAFIQAAGDYYLTPLPQTGEVPELLTALLEPVWGRQQRLERIYSVAEDDSEQPATLLGVGYQTVRTQVSTVDGQPVTWQERVLVVYSPTSARRTRRGLAERLEKAKQALHGLTPTPGRGHRQWHDLPALQANAQAILKHYRVEGLLEVSYQHEATQRTVRQYGAHPARTEEQARYVVQVARNYAAIRAARRHLGWRLYVTNTPVAELSLAKAVVAYRGAPNIERGFHRLKGHPLGLSPVYVQREDHAKGLARLLSLGLRVLTLVEHKVRQELKSAGQMLQGLHTGNLHRPSKRPTAERLLAAFEGITLTIVHLPDQTIRHITPLSALQRRILELLGLPVSIYESLTQVAQPIPP